MLKQNHIDAQSNVLLNETCAFMKTYNLHRIFVIFDNLEDNFYGFHFTNVFIRHCTPKKIFFSVTENFKTSRIRALVLKLPKTAELVIALETGDVIDIIYCLIQKNNNAFFTTEIIHFCESWTAAKEMKGKCRVRLTDEMTVFPMLLE